MDKINELSLGQKIIGATGILLLIDSFLPWFKKDYGAGSFSGTYTKNGWGSFLSLLAVLIAIALVAFVAVRAFADVNLPDKLGNLGWGQVQLIAAAVSLALIVLQLLIGKKVSIVSLDRALGIYIGVVLAAAMTYGAFLTMKDPAPTRGPGPGPGPGGPPPGPPAGGPPPTV